MIFDLVGQIVAKTEYIIPLFLATIFAAGVLSSRSKIPYTIILVGIGVVISLLIFVAMMKVNYQEFKKIRISALVLSTVGVILAIIIGGYLLMYIAGLPLIVAFAFAALIAPTDAAIVIEIFKRVTVPRVLATLMESEASFNDATGVIAFSSILAIAIGSGALELGSSSSAFTGAINVNLTGEAEHFSI